MARLFRAFLCPIFSYSGCITPWAGCNGRSNSPLGEFDSGKCAAAFLFARRAKPFLSMSKSHQHAAIGRAAQTHSPLDYQVRDFLSMTHNGQSAKSTIIALMVAYLNSEMCETDTPCKRQQIAWSVDSLLSLIDFCHEYGSQGERRGE